MAGDGVISRDDAELQWKVLVDAYQVSPVPTVKGYLRALAREYELAVGAVDAALNDSGVPTVIVPAAAVMVGCVVWTKDEFGRVARVANGGTGIQIIHPDYGARWVNPLTSSSPVVIER